MFPFKYKVSVIVRAIFYRELELYMNLLTNIGQRLQAKTMLKKIRTSNYYSHFYNDSLSIIDEKKILYTEVSKVACTKIKKTLFQISQDDAHAVIDSTSIHRKKCNNFKGANNYSDLELYNILKSDKYFKFCFVRNPYYRALSAYNDKIFFPFQTNEYTRMHYKILEWAGTKGLNGNHHFVTFEAFIKYICQQSYFEMDRHWMPQHIALWHPLIEYDFVGRYEDFTNDFKHVLETIGASDSLINMIDLKENEGTEVASAFTEETANIFYTKFINDFTLYGYDEYSWARPQF